MEQVVRARFAADGRAQLRTRQLTAADFHREMRAVPGQAARVPGVVVMRSLDVLAAREQRNDARMLEHVVVQRCTTAALGPDDHEVRPSPQRGRCLTVTAQDAFGGLTDRLADRSSAFLGHSRLLFVNVRSAGAVNCGLAGFRWPVARQGGRQPGQSWAQRRENASELERYAREVESDRERNQA